MKKGKKLMALMLSFALTFASIGMTTITSVAAENVLTKGAWYESIYIEWNGVGGSSYNVYYKESSADDTAYTKVDSELVRQVTGSGYRVDVLGLKGGTSYDVKVVAVTGGKESATPVVTYTATPEAYDRSGFAFDGTSNAPGAYKADGTPEDGALILYVTENNKKNVYNNKTIKSILGGFNSINGGKPVILRVIGKVTPLSTSDLNPGMWKNTCGVTIEGVGPGSGFYGWGIGSGDNRDTEFRNMNFADYPEDAIGFQQADKLWVHNNNFYSGYNPKDSTAERDKLHGDGSCDLRECNRVTVSYNHFDNTDKTALIGSSSNNRESTGNITFHHNFFDHTSQRTPRVRWHNIHAYNNYYYGTKAYGIGATCNSSIFAENNFFEDAQSPLVTSSQGGYGTFSDNEGGVIKAYNNTMVNTRMSTPGVDYFESPSREYRLTAADYTTKKGGWTYNNFDASGYIGSNNYVLHTPDEAKSIVLSKAGSINDTTFSVDSVAPPKVVGNITATYYYDSDISGSTGSAFGGINGVGTYFKGSGNCEPGSASGYRETEQYSYSGRFSASSAISFKTSSRAKFTIVASSDATAPVRMELTNSANPDAVYHGTFQSGCKGNDVLTTIDLLEAGTYSFKPASNVDIYYIEVQEFDGEEPTTQETVSEATTEATTIANITTEVTTKADATTETTTEGNIENIELGEGIVGFESNTTGDTGAGTSVRYDAPTDTWYLTDTSTTASATLTVPFTAQTKGKVIVKGKVTPSSSSSKWALATIKGTTSGGIANTEIVSVATDASKIVSVRTLNADGTQNHTAIGSTLKANQTYEFTFIIDLDNNTADVTVDGVTKTVAINASSVDSFFTLTSMKSARNINVIGLRAGVISEVTGDKTTETTTAATTESTTVETTTIATTESTTVETTTVATTESTTAETTTESTSESTTAETTTVSTTESTTVETTTESTTAETTTESTSESTTEDIPSPSDFKYGDADGNGVVNIVDCAKVLSKVIKSSKLEIEDMVTDFMKYIDVDKDNAITSADVANILQKVIDNSYLMPVEK